MLEQLRRHGRFALAFAMPLLIVVSAGVVYVATTNPIGPASLRFLPDADDESGAGRLPRLAKSARAAPDSNLEGNRVDYGSERASRMTYPAESLELEWLNGARDAFAEVASAFAATNRNGNSSWVPLGPDSAVYQETPFRRFYYNPSRYVSSGRVTAVAIAPTCTINDCRLWVAAAGGGVWRTDRALSQSPKWNYLTGNIPHNAIGAITVDPTDASGNTIWVGTGEPNVSGDSSAGVGLLRSTDGGNTWSAPIGASAFAGRGISSIVINPVNPQIMYVGTVVAVSGIASTGGFTVLVPGAALWGLYKTTDGGATWTYVHNGAAAVCTSPPIVSTPLGNLSLASAILNGFTPCSPRGVQDVALDPLNPNIVYAASGGRGIWRSTNAGDTWTRIKPTVFEETTGLPATLLNATFGNAFGIVSEDRASFDVTTLPGNKTRMYVAQGAIGGSVIVGTTTFPLYSRFSRSDDVTASTPVFAQLTSADPANPGYGSYNFCTSQCSYDSFVMTPAGHPNMVYIGGSYLYNEVLRSAASAVRGISNGRGVLLSVDAGVSFHDQTEDSSNKLTPNGIHPDQHAIVVNPNNPLQFFEGSDGGMIRSDGNLEDSSDRCSDRPLSAIALTRCQQLLSNTPKRLDSLNVGLTTLQFQTLSLDPGNSKHIMGGTQDNGTFESSGSTSIWQQVFWGDGGLSGFDASDQTFRFHTLFNATPEVNFTNGAVHDWNWIADPLAGNTEPRAFYIPIISDPVESGWMFAGLSHVWRTKTHGLGSLSVQDLRDQCNRLTGAFDIPVCGDWEPLAANSYVPPPPFNAAGNPSAASRLTGTKYGTDRTGGNVAVVKRAITDSTTLWAATSAGRLFISKNVDAEPAAAVVFTRLDSTAANDPNRFVSGIAIDPANANHAWVSYTGFTAATPTLPGHVFEVLFNPATGTATWTSRDFNLGDIPLTDVALDDLTGDVYVSSDFGVMRLAAGANTWTLAAAGLPRVEVSSLTIAVADRQLFAATHGLSAWVLALR